MRDVLIFPHEHRTTLNLGIFPCIDCNPAKPTEGFSYISNTLLGTNIIFHPKACLSRAFSFSQSWGSVSSLEGSCICKTKLETDSSSLAIWIEIMQTKGYVHNIYISYVPISTGLKRLSFINPETLRSFGVKLDDGLENKAVRETQTRLHNCWQVLIEKVRRYHKSKFEKSRRFKVGK